MKIYPLLAALSVFLVFGCTNTEEKASESVTDEGFVDVKGGKVWYKVLGSDKSAIPLLVVHGGPGSRSCGKIEAFELLAEERPVVLFDQLESGLSDRPNDTTLWKLPYFVDQVETVKNHLGLGQFHLLGSSWGGAIAVEYMLTKNTQDVESVIFAGPLLSTPIWIEDAKKLVAKLSQPIQDTIKKYEELGEYTNENYLAATDTFYSEFLTRKQWPAKKWSACDTVPGFNAKIYNYMWGPTEFTATGTLKDFNRLDRLSEIKTPSLVIIGEYDEVLPETARLFQSELQNAKLSIIAGAGHAKTTDNPRDYINEIQKFLVGVESN